ncbi:UNVERIFIED_CONTAM: hypothetical protein PYX00_008972 [Menopon gallinae]|uniref:Uncharacterized protein n=1 Tax=Menopon gallinae TaxID=328185 RepID=A0AAW2H9X3_9NEOP
MGNIRANTTMEEAVSQSTESTTPGKVYSDLIKISEKESPQEKYDTVSYSQAASDSRPAQTTFPDPKIFILENGKTYEVGQQPIQAPNPYLNAAIGAVSAHLISHAHEEYIPYPPNGNPQDYPAYRGNDSPLSGAYERANRAGYGYYPSHQDQPHYGAYYQQPQTCYPHFYPGDTDLDDRGYGRRGKEPIKRQVLLTSFG